MYDAQYIFKGNSVYTPWMGRSGDNVLIFAEMLDRVGVNVTIELVHKNSEDPGNGTRVDLETILLTGKDYVSQEWSGLKELVRFKIYTVGGSAKSDYGLLRVLNPVWFDDVRA